ncbi:hypothetical protein [Humibacter albus]|uniref:hypothetical protein n=1 Tax=Humibacter albus TaxID=427754 RepID=UPI0003B638B4|nr:hypothetical protein [Humibacter albus]
MITVSRAMLVALAALFSAYHVVLGIVSMGVYRHPAPVIVAIGLYAAATVLSLLNTRRVALAVWIAAFCLAVSVAMPVLVTSQLDPAHENGYATWYVAAIGTLMTIVVVRRRNAFAWLGTLFLVVHTLVFAGIVALGAWGVIGSVVWVAAATVVTRALSAMSRDGARFARAERQVVDWHAEQEAHVIERQRRLDETYRRAAPLLIRITETGGVLTDEERAECLLLEAGMRDEIRGRELLDDEVRERILDARRRGATVSVLDDGGLDGLREDELARIRARLADAIGHSRATKFIVRTVERSSPVAVTVVGLVPATRAPQPDDGSEGPRNAVDTAAAESEGEDDEVELWLEIPRREEAAEDPEHSTSLREG